MITTLLLLVVGQTPVIRPPLSGPPLAAPPAVEFRVPFIGAPGIAWNGSDYLIAWKDQRRSASPGGGATTFFFTTWDGGVATTFPQGRPLLGGPPAVPTPEATLVAATNTTTFVGHVVPSPDGGTTLVLRWTGDGGVTAPWLVSTPSLGVSRLVQQPVFAASTTSLLAAWYSDDAIHLYQWPGGGRGVLDGGPNLTSLSAGEADGGFLVAWIDSVSRPIVSLVSGTPPIEVRRDVPSVTASFQVQVVSSPAIRQVSVLSGPSTASVMQTVAWGGVSWSPAAFISSVVGAEGTPTTATANAVISTYSTSLGRYFRVTGPFTPSTGSGAPLFTPFYRTLALADDEEDVVALSTFDGELFGQTVTVNLTMPPTVAVGAPVTLLRAPATRRFPSAVWSDPDDRFLLAWDESQPDASFRVMTSYLDLDGGMTPAAELSGVPVTTNGSRPVLLRRPDGGEQGVQLGPSPGSRAVYKVSRGGTLSLGAQLTTTGPFSGAVMGSRSIAQWGGTAAGTLIRTDFDVSPRLDRAGLPPACAFHQDESFWFTLATDGGLVHAQLSDGALLPTMLWPEAATIAPSSVCASLTDAPGSMILAWRTMPGVMARLVDLPPTGSSRPIFSASESPVEGPFVVPTRSGALIVWSTDSFGVRASFFTDGGATFPFTLGSGEVSNVSVAGSPLGVAVVVWDRFDTDAGARQVELRLVDTVRSLSGRDAGPDAGPDASVPAPDGGVDGGSDGGGGTVDAGELDAGLFGDGGATDGGATDAGELDAGASDGGAPGAGDGGQGSTTVFVPACGCGALSPSMGFTLVALLGLARARRRLRAR